MLNLCYCLTSRALGAYGSPSGHDLQKCHLEVWNKYNKDTFTHEIEFNFAGSLPWTLKRCHAIICMGYVLQRIAVLKMLSTLSLTIHLMPVPHWQLQSSLVNFSFALVRLRSFYKDWFSTFRFPTAPCWGPKLACRLMSNIFSSKSGLKSLVLYRAGWFCLSYRLLRNVVPQD